MVIKPFSDLAPLSTDIMPLDVRQVLIKHYHPFRLLPNSLQICLVGAMRLLLKEARINKFLATHAELRGVNFIEQVFDELNFSYQVNQNDLGNIPVHGPLIIVANHPLGGLDGLSLLHLISTVRRDVKVVANHLLKQITQLSDLFLCVDSMSGETCRQDIRKIEQALQNGQAVIFFPSGEVSRASSRGIRDKSWKSGFLRFAEKFQVPILPVHIAARNSALFYALSRMSLTLSMLCLPREMVSFSGHLHFSTGEKIKSHRLREMSLSRAEKVRLIQRHVYSLRKNRSPYIITQKDIASPKDRQHLKHELARAENLGRTIDGKSVLLVRAEDSPTVLEEIGRLREEAFRAVGEGTGRRLDIDHFDYYYRHIVVWDETLLEIAGSYRLGEIWAWPDKDITKLYSNTLFSYRESSHSLFLKGLELGRSFVQPQFWGRRSLDYLWQGIGAYIACHPQVRYLFGPVSLSGLLPEQAKALLVQFYASHYSDPEHLAEGRQPFYSLPQHMLFAEQLIPGLDRDSEFSILRKQLDYLGVKIPTLYKQYADICEQGGVRFSAFNVDPDFNYCIDGLVRVDLDLLKESKRERYIKK